MLTDPDSYGRMFGGTVVPLDVEPELFGKYATGLDPDRGDFGKVIERDPTLVCDGEGRVPHGKTTRRATARRAPALSEPTQMALKGTPQFEYWSLCDQFPDAEDKLLSHIDDPVPLDTFKRWHDALVHRVEAAAAAWATT